MFSSFAALHWKALNGVPVSYKEQVLASPRILPDTTKLSERQVGVTL
jgi:hypothetical protein